MPKSSTVMNVSLNSSQMVDADPENMEELAEANQRLRSLVQRLASTLTTILDVDVALRNNLMSMHEILTEVQEEVAAPARTWDSACPALKKNDRQLKNKRTR